VLMAQLKQALRRASRVMFNAALTTSDIDVDLPHRGTVQHVRSREKSRHVRRLAQMLQSGHASAAKWAHPAAGMAEKRRRGGCGLRGNGGRRANQPGFGPISVGHDGG
jgi:hypothetical protein